MQYNCDSILYKSAPYKVQKCMKPLFMKHEAIFRGVFRDVTYFMEGPRCVTKCDKREGVSKLAKNSVTYFMDGPKSTAHSTNYNLVHVVGHIVFV